MKAEASGYPSWIRSPADEDRYISEFAASEGIQLVKCAIGTNPANRGLAKLCLNSMWDKLTERKENPHEDDFRPAGTLQIPRDARYRSRGPHVRER